jgi:hypothetical protein
MLSPVRNRFLDDLRSEDVDHDAVVGDNGGGVNIRNDCVVNVLRDADADGPNISCDVISSPGVKRTILLGESR